MGGHFVYRFVSDEGVTEYVGATSFLNKRIGQHLKSLGLVFGDEVLTGEVQYVELKTRTDAFVLEFFLINELKPEHNKANKYKGELNIELKNEIEWLRLDKKTYEGEKEQEKEKEKSRQTLWLDEDLIKRIKIQAIKEKRNVNDIVEELLEDYLKARE